jgi:hypothetical protein
MIRLITITAVTLVTALPAAAQTYPTIVGEWYAEEVGPQDCGGPHAVHIGAMHYVEEALSCEFEDVARDRWQVTWNGSCNDGAGSSPMRLVATETEGRLTLNFNGNPGWSALRRCTQKSGSAPAAFERVPLVYTEYAADSDEASLYWGDVVDMVAKFDPPPVVPLTVHVAQGAGYTFAYVTGGMVCGTGHGCPERIFQDGEKLGEFSACENLDSHAVAIDGSRFYDCDSDASEGRLIASFAN